MPMFYPTNTFTNRQLSKESAHFQDFFMPLRGSEIPPFLEDINQDMGKEVKDFNNSRKSVHSNFVENISTSQYSLHDKYNDEFCCQNDKKTNKGDDHGETDDTSFFGDSNDSKGKQCDSVDKDIIFEKKKDILSIHSQGSIGKKTFFDSSSCTTQQKISQSCLEGVEIAREDEQKCEHKKGPEIDNKPNERSPAIQHESKQTSISESSSDKTKDAKCTKDSTMISNSNSLVSNSYLQPKNSESSTIKESIANVKTESPFDQIKQQISVSTYSKERIGSKDKSVTPIDFVDLQTSDTHSSLRQSSAKEKTTSKSNDNNISEKIDEAQIKFIGGKAATDQPIRFARKPTVMIRSGVVKQSRRLKGARVRHRNIPPSRA